MVTFNQTKGGDPNRLVDIAYLEPNFTKNQDMWDSEYSIQD